MNLHLHKQIYRKHDNEYSYALKRIILTCRHDSSTNGFFLIARKMENIFVHDFIFIIINYNYYFGCYCYIHLEILTFASNVFQTSYDICATDISNQTEKHRGNEIKNEEIINRNG